MNEKPALKSRVIEHVALHPDVSRALRATVAFAVPLMICHYLGRSADAVFIAFPAQNLSLQDLRGAYRVRLGVLATMTFMAALSAILGVVTAENMVGAVLVMGGLALLSGLWRHLSSEYGPALGISSAFLFLLGLTQEGGWPAALHMGQCVLLGCVVATGFQIAFWIVRPQHPLRYAVAETWVAASDLLASMRLDSEPEGAKSEERIANFERELRLALDRTFKILGAAESRQPASFLARLEEVRREVVHLSMRGIAFHQALEKIVNRPELARLLPLHDPFWKALSETARSVALNLILYRSENLALLNVRLRRCEHFSQILDEQLAALPEDPPMINSARAALGKITGVFPRIRSALGDVMGDKGRRFNFPATLPELGARSIQSLAAWTDPAPQVDMVVVRYAVRMAVLTMLAVALYKGCGIPRGYWIALTIIVVLQPDYGSTRERAAARIAGTVAGTLLASALLWVRMPIFALDGLAALTSFGFVFFLKRRYGLAVFFVTLMVVLLTETTASVHLDFTIVRLIATLAGAGLALLAAWIFWPVWERETFATLLADAVRANRAYLECLSGPRKSTEPKAQNVLLVKRRAENASRFATASLQRLLHEPKVDPKNAERAEAMTVYNHRVTRALTGLAIHLDDGTWLNDPKMTPLIQDAAVLLEDIARGIEKPEEKAGDSNPSLSIRKLEAAIGNARAADPQDQSINQGSAGQLLWTQFARLIAEIRVMTLTLDG